MGVFNFLKKAIPGVSSSSLSRAERTVNQALHEYWVHQGFANIMPDDPEKYLTDGYSSNTTVYSIVTRVDNMRKQAKLKLYKKDKSGEKVEVDDHDLLRFLEKVNKHTSMDDFTTLNIIYMMTVGESFTYKPRITAGANAGKVIELHTLPSADVEIVEGTIFQPVQGYKLESMSNIVFSVEDVYHSKLVNPNWRSERSLHGLSPLRAAARTVSKLNQSEITELKQLENQGAPFILFRKNEVGSTVPQRLTDTQVYDLVKKIKSASEQSSRGLPLVLKDEFGKLDLGQKIADMELLESSAAGIIALCSVYGLPPELFGYGQKTYNNMATARKSAWTDCIMPTLDRHETTLNNCTIAGTPYQSEGYFWGYDYSDVEELQEGYQTQVDWMKKAYWTANEIREATGKNRIDNPAMDEPMIAMGDTPLSDFGMDLDGEKSFDDYIK